MSAQQNNQKHSINSLVVVDELFAGVWPFWGVEGLMVEGVDGWFQWQATQNIQTLMKLNR